MTPEDIRDRITMISESYDHSGDDESAHAAEDKLYRAVLRSIADGNAEPAVQAREALKSRNLKFARWFA